MSNSLGEQKGRARGHVLLVDDEDSALVALRALLQASGFTVDTARDAYEAFARLERQPPDVLLTDLRMPGMDGLSLLERAHEVDPDLPVLVMTAFGDVETAVEAMRAGAENFLVKPLDQRQLEVALERALERRRMRTEVRELRERVHEKLSYANLVGSAPVMQAIYKTVAQVAPSGATVLITGESGTGKELVAQAIHERSTRATRPFVKLHCAALAESLLESELFGHEKGSFTGGIARREGRFKQADSGTLFLDEIGEISPAVQIKLLRFLQERTFERVGGNDTLKVDVRVIAATNRDLRAEVAAGRFREDLFYRLNVVSIEMPPLRTRPSDIPILATKFLEKFAKSNEKNIVGFEDDALARLVEYRWPGNVRELENVIERAVIMCEHDRISVRHLPLGVASVRIGAARIPGSTLAEIERHAILTTLQECNGSTSRAAQMLGISVRTVQYRLHEYGVARPPGSQPRGVQGMAS